MKLMTMTPLCARAGRQRRGSVLIIVVALLAVMGLLIMTFGYLTRIDLLAARNWANSVQTRMAAASEIPVFSGGESGVDMTGAGDVAPVMLSSAGRTARLAALPIQLELAAQPSLTGAGRGGAAAINPLAEMQVFDTSARLNINAIVPARPGEEQTIAQAPSETELARLIAAVMAEKGLTGPSPDVLARRIVARRLGEDVVTSATAGVPPASDPRLAPAHEERPYAQLGELLAIPGMTRGLYRALEPHLTVLSVSHAAFELEGLDAGERISGWPQLDPNTAPAEPLYETLRMRFPQMERELIGQFVVNLIDRRDADPVPTEVELEGKTYRGVELSPYINEICTNNIGFLGIEQTDRDGQFVELHNPYQQKSFSLDGWTLAGAGAEIPLVGTLPPGGFLVLTDDFNNAQDRTRRQTPNSLFTVFGVVSSGPGAIIYEHPTLDLMAGEGRLTLKDKRGRVVDAFDYDPSARTPQRVSLQRLDPRLNIARQSTPTPLAPNQGLRELERRQVQFALQAMEEHHDKPFQSALDVMLVSSSFVTAGGEGSTEARERPWQLPVLASEDSKQLDVRLVDCFRIGVRLPAAPEPVPAAGIPTPDPAGMRPPLPTRGGLEMVTTPTAAVVYGLVNLNTASPAVLGTLPGMDEPLLLAIYKAREAAQTGVVGHGRLGALSAEERWRELSPQSAQAWPNLSDFLLDEQIWGETPLYQRLTQAWPFASLVGTHSMSMLAVATSRPEPIEAGSTRRPNLARSERLLAGDRGRLETVSFRYLGGESIGDPDQRGAVGLSRAGGLLYRPGRLEQDLAARFDRGRSVKKNIDADQTTGGRNGSDS